MKKKGLTPIISTVLLILFAVALGTLVMSWGSSDSFRIRGCDDAEIAITRLGETSQICTENGIIKGIVENNGRAYISGMEILILTDASSFKEELNIGINPGEFGRLSFRSQAGAASIKKIRVIPKVNDEICINERYETESIDVC